MPTVWVSAQCSVEVDGEVDDGLVLECDIVTCTLQVRPCGRQLRAWAAPGAGARACVQDRSLRPARLNPPWPALHFHAAGHADAAQPHGVRL